MDRHNVQQEASGNTGKQHIRICVKEEALWLAGDGLEECRHDTVDASVKRGLHLRLVLACIR